MFYKNVGRLWWVSDCEELVGVTHRRWWGVGFRNFIIVLLHSPTYQWLFLLCLFELRSIFFLPWIPQQTLFHQVKCLFLDHLVTHSWIPLHTFFHQTKFLSLDHDIPRSSILLHTSLHEGKCIFHDPHHIPLLGNGTSFLLDILIIIWWWVGVWLCFLLVV